MKKAAFTAKLVFGVLFFCAIGARAEEAARPPKYLFHAGEYSRLRENGKLGNVPEAAWNKHVMGGEGRYPLLPFRRGLYGADSATQVEYYADLYIGEKGKIPWLMRIELDESCLTKQASSTIYEDPRFLPWLIPQLDKFIADAPTCLNASSIDCNDLFDRRSVENIRPEGPENICEKSLASFIADNKIKIVMDSEWDRSWYIRDRACIRNIQSDPEHLLEWYADMPWAEGQYGSMPNGSYGAGWFAMLFRALAEASSERVKSETLDRLNANAQASTFSAFPPELLGDKHKKQWVAENAPAMIEAYRRCQAGKDLPRFRKEAEEWAGLMQQETMEKAEKFLPAVWSLTERLDKLCR